MLQQSKKMKKYRLKIIGGIVTGIALTVFCYYVIMRLMNGPLNTDSNLIVASNTVLGMIGWEIYKANR
jgi:flagellar biogenesis protein FliO